MRAAGISVSCDAGDDTTYCGTHGINIYLDIMINALERLDHRRRLQPEGDRGEPQELRKDNMKRQEVQTEHEFRRQLFSALYGPDHPYTKAESVTPDMVASIGHDDARRTSRASTTPPPTRP